jgi:hypothetical protein
MRSTCSCFPMSHCSLCLVQARLIGVIEAERTQEGKTIRNDRVFTPT